MNHRSRRVMQRILRSLWRHGFTASPAETAGRLATGSGAAAAGLAVSLMSTTPLLAQEAIDVSDISHGSAEFHQDGALTEITASDQAIINYNRFDIPADAAVHFNQPDEAARVLNRVQAGDPSQIDGALTGDGHVYLVNPAGVSFGPDSVVDVGRFYAAAGDIADADFLDGNHRFVSGPGELVNEGVIRGEEGAHLIGRHVANHGAILAPRGVASLTAGDVVHLQEQGRRLQVRVDNLDAATGKVDQGEGTPQGEAREGETGVQHSGHAEGEAVYFAVGDVYSLAMESGATVEAERPDGSGGDVTLAAGERIEQDGHIDASGRAGSGGQVKMLGYEVSVGGSVDASGSEGGGEVLIGGDAHGEGPHRNAERTHIRPEADLRADGLEAGDGGSVIVWSDNLTGFYGNLSARGGPEGGDGGFAEVSGRITLDYRGGADLAAPHPDGSPGHLLLDPTDITIQSTDGTVMAGPDDGLFAPDGDPDAAVLSVESLEAALAGGSVTVTTESAGGGDGDITIADGFSWDTASDLTLLADRHIDVMEGVEIAKTGGGPATLTLSALEGNVHMQPGSSITSTAGALDTIMLAGGGVTLDDATILTGGGALSLGVAPAEPGEYGDRLPPTPPSHVQVTDSLISTGGGDLEVVGTGGAEVPEAVRINGTTAIDTDEGIIEITGTHSAGTGTLVGVEIGPGTAEEPTSIEGYEVYIEGAVDVADAAEGSAAVRLNDDTSITATRDDFGTWFEIDATAAFTSGYAMELRGVLDSPRDMYIRNHTVAEADAPPPLLLDGVMLQPRRIRELRTDRLELANDPQIDLVSWLDIMPDRSDVNIGIGEEAEGTLELGDAFFDSINTTRLSIGQFSGNHEIDVTALPIEQRTRLHAGGSSGRITVQPEVSTSHRLEMRAGDTLTLEQPISTTDRLELEARSLTVLGDITVDRPAGFTTTDLHMRFDDLDLGEAPTLDAHRIAIEMWSFGRSIGLGPEATGDFQIDQALLDQLNIGRWLQLESGNGITLTENSYDHDLRLQGGDLDFTGPVTVGAGEGTITFRGGTVIADSPETIIAGIVEVEPRFFSGTTALGDEVSGDIEIDQAAFDSITEWVDQIRFTGTGNRSLRLGGIEIADQPLDIDMGGDVEVLGPVTVLEPQRSLSLEAGDTVAIADTLTLAGGNLDLEAGVAIELDGTISTGGGDLLMNFVLDESPEGLFEEGIAFGAAADIDTDGGRIAPNSDTLIVHEDASLSEIIEWTMPGDAEMLTLAAEGDMRVVQWPEVFRAEVGEQPGGPVIEFIEGTHFPVPTNLAATQNLEVAGPVSAAGSGLSLMLLADADATDAGTLDVQAGADIGFEDGLILRGGEVAVSPEATLDGSGAIELSPARIDRSIGVAGAGGDFQIDTALIEAVTGEAGNELVIGQSEGEHMLQTGELTLDRPLALQSAGEGGQVHLVEPLSLTGEASWLTILAGDAIRVAGEATLDGGTATLVLGEDAIETELPAGITIEESGAILSGGGPISLLNEAGTGILVDGLLSSEPGEGGELIVQNATVNVSPVVGAGNISLINVTEDPTDLIINDNIIDDITIDLTATRDIIINAPLETTAPDADILLTADDNTDGDGGILINPESSIQSAGDVVLTGSRLVTAGDGQGVLINGGAVVAEGGTVNIAGGLDAQGSNSDGVVIRNGAMVSADNGSIHITGAAPTGHTGIRVDNATVMAAMGIGSPGSGEGPGEGEYMLPPNNGGNVVLTTDTLRASGESAFIGAGEFHARPLDPTVGIGIGAAASGVLRIEESELATIEPGFNALRFGRADGSHPIEIATVEFPFTAPVIFQAPASGGQIFVDQTLWGVNDASFTFIGPGGDTTTLSADVFTEGQPVTFNDSVVVNTDVEIDTTGQGAVAEGGNITFDGPIDGAQDFEQDLTLAAGSGGDIAFNAAVGQQVPLGDTTVVSAQNVTATEAFATASFTQAEGTGDTTMANLQTQSGEADINTDGAAEVSVTTLPGAVDPAAQITASVLANVMRDGDGDDEEEEGEEDDPAAPAEAAPWLVELMELDPDEPVDPFIARQLMARMQRFEGPALETFQQQLVETIGEEALEQPDQWAQQLTPDDPAFGPLLELRNLVATVPWLGVDETTAARARANLLGHISPEAIDPAELEQMLANLPAAALAAGQP